MSSMPSTKYTAQYGCCHQRPIVTVGLSQSTVCPSGKDVIIHSFCWCYLTRAHTSRLTRVNRAGVRSPTDTATRSSFHSILLKTLCCRLLPGGPMPPSWHSAGLPGRHLFRLLSSKQHHTSTLQRAAGLLQPQRRSSYTHQHPLQTFSSCGPTCTQRENPTHTQRRRQVT